MRIRRGLLFWGLFLIPLGGITLLVRARRLDPAVLADSWRLWPVILIVLGLVLLLGRSRAGLAGTAATGLALGIIAGGALATGNIWIGAIAECAPSGGTTERLDRSGTLEAPTAVRLDLRCGSIDLSTSDSADWRLEAVHRGPAPVVSETPGRLEIRVPERGGARRHDWTLRLPAGQLREVELTANAATATLDLAGAALADLDATINAGDLLVDATSATVDRIRVSMNAGRTRIALAGGAATGSLSVNAGSIDLCVAPTAALRLRVEEQLTFAHNLDDRGLARSGTTWTRAGGGPLVDLSIVGNAASLTLDPEGGCR